MDKWLLMFFLGAILSLFLPIVPALFYIVLLLTAVVGLIISKKMIYLTGLLLGCAWILFNGYIYQQSLPVNHLEKNNLHKNTHIITGKILTLQTNNKFDHQQINVNNVAPKSGGASTERTTNQQRFNLEVNSIDYIKLSHPFVVRLSWQSPQLTLKQGFEVRLKVKLKPAHGFANSGGFNYQIWLVTKNIVATGYVVNSKDNLLLQNKSSFRQQQYDRLQQLIPEHYLSPLISALTLGERGGVTPEQWQVLKATGTQHLIAISGLHLGLVATSLFIFALFVIRITPLYLFRTTRIAKLVNQINAKHFAIFISLAVTCYYAALSGYAIPTVRALLMLSLYWLSRIMGINLSLTRWLLLVVFFVLITTPMSILSASFWLSFYAVCVIFLLLWRCTSYLTVVKNTQKAKFVAFFKSLFILQLGLSLLLLPVTLFFYHQLSLVAFLANILAVPWMSFSAIPLSLSAIIILPFSESISLWLFQWCLTSLEILWQWLSYLSQQPWSLQSLAKSQILTVSVIIFIFSICWFVQLKWRYYGYFLPFFFAIILNHLWLKPLGWQVTVLDVGHGLAVVIERDQHVILYDTGPKYPSGFNLADAAILPFLQQRGITKIDKIIISHNDNDHFGGLAVLQQKIAIKEIIYNEVLKESVNEAFLPKTKQQHCLQGQRFTWQKLTFEQLWPTTVAGDDNDDSCIVRVSDGKRSVLLTGDASKKVERKLVKNKSNIEANIIIAPHHGSKSSSSELFLQAVKPQYAIFSSGYLNRWKMPVSSVLLNYHRNHIKTYNTAESGMIQVKFTDDDMKLSTYRKDYFPYWFAN